MGRPRKDSDVPPAERRAIDAFWALIEAHPFTEVTVSMVAARAECSRSTFYAKFDGMPDLLRRAVAQEFLDQRLFPNLVFRILTGDEADVLPDTMENGRLFYRLSLLTRQGGGELARQALNDVVLSLWRSALCPHGGELTPEAEAVIRFVAGGVMASLAWQAEAHPGQFVLGDLYGLSYMRSISSTTFGHVCRAQGAGREAVLARAEAMVAMLDQARTRPGVPR